MGADRGQNSQEWNNFWKGYSSVSEIRSWDFYGGRQWITKYVSRFGKTLEAGCGLGRNVFYLRRLGIDIEGLDFSEKVISELNNFKHGIDEDAVFHKGDITKLNYEDNSLSSYISTGVIEHFKEGPYLALKEAFRVLRPGGIAIITTPNLSFSQFFFRIKRNTKDLIKKIINYPQRPFFQYEYTPGRLKKFLENEGFLVTRSEGCDVFYAFRELLGNSGKEIKEGSALYKLISCLENTKFRHLGAQSVTISVKPSDLMYCFLSGEYTATPDSLEKYDVPISDGYQNTEIAKLFLKGRPVLFAENYKILPDLLEVETRECSISGKKYYTDPVFEDFGININVAPDYLLKPEINIELCTNNLKPVFRRRKNS